MKPAKKIWINGEIENLSAAKIFSFHQGLNYGACVYEGIRCYKTKQGPGIFRVREHVNRFFYSASALRMNLGYTKSQLISAIKDIVRVNNLESAYIRPMAFYSDAKMGINIFDSRVTTILFVWPWKEGTPHDSKVSLHITKYRRLNPETIDIKAKVSGYYANGLLGFIDAKESGFDQPLFLDVKGYVAEGAINNIFLIKNKVLYTPTTRNILGGITRDSVIALAKDLEISVVEKDMTPEFIKNADEVFLTGTGIELQKVVKIDNLFTLKKDTPVTDALSKEYYTVAMGNTKKHKSWISLV